MSLLRNLPEEESGLIMNDKGILVSPDFMMLKAENLKKAGQEAMKSYEEKRQKALNAPTPGIEVPFSCVLTKAVQPKMINALKSLGLHQEKLDVDERFLDQMKYMNDNVSDEQEILLVGNLVDKLFAPGKMAKINYARYRTVRDNNDGVIQTTYDIPTHVIGGFKYLMIDQRDIIWVSAKEIEQEDQE